MPYDAPDDFPEHRVFRVMSGGMDVRIVSDNAVREDRLCLRAARILLNGIDLDLVRQIDQKLQ